MRLRRISLEQALDAWSDFAIDCWAFAFRLVLALLAAFYFLGLTGRWDAALFERLSSHGVGIAALVFAGGMVMAIAFRLERAFTKQMRKRGPQLSGGRTAPTRRPKRQRWANRKRKRKT